MNFVLKIECPDQIGLVAKIANLLAASEINISSTHEFVDQPGNKFFMRSEFSSNKSLEHIKKQLAEKLPNPNYIELKKLCLKDIVVFATKEYHCIGDLLLQCGQNDLNANIKAVISNHDDLRSLVEKFEIPFHHITNDGKSREQHEAELLATMAQYYPEYLILAKYMRILSPQFIGKYPNRIINIHHSFLPAFIGASPYKQAFDRGVKIIGATSHFVNDNLDGGAIIAQKVISVDHSHSAKEMAKCGRDVERTTLAIALKLVLEERVFVNNNKTIIFD